VHHFRRSLARTHVRLIDLPFYKKHPKRTGTALGIAGGIVLAPVAAVCALAALGLTTAGVAFGNVVLFALAKESDVEFTVQAVSLRLSSASYTGVRPEVSSHYSSPLARLWSHHQSGRY
jgi:hypothetical protein